MFALGGLKYDFVHLFVDFDKQAEVLELGIQLVKLVLERVDFLAVHQPCFAVGVCLYDGFELFHPLLKILIETYNQLIVVVAFHLVFQFLLEGLHSFDRVV